MHAAVIALCSPVLLVFQHRADLGPTFADRFCAPGRFTSLSFVLVVNTPPFYADKQLRRICAVLRSRQHPVVMHVGRGKERDAAMPMLAMYQRKKVRQNDLASARLANVSGNSG
jgi:hypothetical protein